MIYMLIIKKSKIKRRKYVKHITCANYIYKLYKCELCINVSNLSTCIFMRSEYLRV